MSAKATPFINVQVTAIPTPGSAPVKYDTKFYPESITVREKDTVINYQLISPTPEGVQFQSVSIVPDHSKQFSDPTISTSGKLLTFSDANTLKADFNLTIHFKDKDDIKFSVDPEVINDPNPD